MPRVKPLGSLRMQLEAAARGAKSNELQRSRDILCELKNLRSEIERREGGKISDEEFAQMIGMEHRRYRTIKENPLRLKLDEIRSIRASGALVGKEMTVGI